MGTGELLTRWTVRAALACYAISIGLMLAVVRRERADRPIRALWTFGCVLYLAHVAAAFQFVHAWSNAAAYRETARQTAALFGIDSGVGLWFNYAFTAAWSADVAYWWLAGIARYRRHRPAWVSVALHGFMAFMAFNATVVFARGPTRWAGAAATAGLLALLARRARHRAHHAQA